MATQKLILQPSSTNKLRIFSGDCCCCCCCCWGGFNTGMAAKSTEIGMSSSCSCCSSRTTFWKAPDASSIVTMLASRTMILPTSFILRWFLCKMNSEASPASSMVRSDGMSGCEILFALLELWLELYSDACRKMRKVVSQKPNKRGGFPTAKTEMRMNWSKGSWVRPPIVSISSKLKSHFGFSELPTGWDRKTVAHIWRLSFSGFLAMVTKVSGWLSWNSLLKDRRLRCGICRFLAARRKRR